MIPHVTNNLLDSFNVVRIAAGLPVLNRKNINEYCIKYFGSIELFIKAYAIGAIRCAFSRELKNVPTDSNSYLIRIKKEIKAVQAEHNQRFPTGNKEQRDAARIAIVDRRYKAVAILQRERKELDSIQKRREARNKIHEDLNRILINNGCTERSKTQNMRFVNQHGGIDNFLQKLANEGVGFIVNETNKDNSIVVDAIFEHDADTCTEVISKSHSQLELSAAIQAARALNKREQIKFKPGYVYVISNPAWPGWFKIGSALDVDARLGTFQVGDPTRSYHLEHFILTEDRRDVEFRAHDFFEQFRGNGEWFQTELAQVKTFLQKYEKS